MPETLNATDAPGATEHAGGQNDRLAPPTRSGASRGQTLFEYGLIIAFVVLAVVLSLTLLAPALNNIFNQVPNAL